MLRPNLPDDCRQHLNQTYEVIVGHARVTVTSRSREEAIQQARQRLCADLPRMWDVIHSLEVQRFQVRQLDN